ncbi:MAG: hypothetical protein U0V04_15255 [Spirosomataceae bacterium]|jgi:hypothetical protein|nr:hypothetical protein [Bacteroidota bacterium]
MLRLRHFVLIISLLFLFDKVNAQTFSYVLQTSTLTFDYTSSSNFNSQRIIPNAFTLSINNSNRGRYNIYCKIVPINSLSTIIDPSTFFSIKYNSSNFTMSSAYQQTFNIGINDQLVANVTGRARKSDTINYNLILNPIDLSNPSNIYNYTIAFTVSEY